MRDDRSGPGGQGASRWAPLSVVPIWNDRGQADLFYFADNGAAPYCRLVNTVERCVRGSFPFAWFAYDRALSVPREWHGTLVEDKADEAGTLYRRERYYEPTTGRFTQEDPIGLAGGLNLYGFASGDPVNFSDPFGLCYYPGGWCHKFLNALGSAEIWRQVREINTNAILGGGLSAAGAFGAASRAAAAARAGAVNVPGPVNSPFGKVDYLLGNVPNNVGSAGKGGFFRGVMGFDEETMEPALRSHFSENAAKGTMNQKGNFEVTGTMVGPNGRSASVTTVWRQGEDGKWNFVTAVPR